MSRQPADMWWFIHRTLGPLASDDLASASLRKTLSAYLGSGSSATATARKLHTHRSTITYRIQRVAAILGDDYPSRAIELAVALKVVAAVGCPPAGWERQEALQPSAHT